MYYDLNSLSDIKAFCRFPSQYSTSVSVEFHSTLNHFQLFIFHLLEDRPLQDFFLWHTLPIEKKICVSTPLRIQMVILTIARSEGVASYFLLLIFLIGIYVLYTQEESIIERCWNEPNQKWWPKHIFVTVLSNICERGIIPL